MLMNDLESPEIFRMADMLGWNGSTEVNLLCDYENMRIIIMRRELSCSLCGEGGFVPIIAVNSKMVCEKCASKIFHQLQGYYRREDDMRWGKR